MRFDHSLPSRLLVRLPGTNKFLTAAGRWAKRAEAALSFPNLFAAIHACLVRGLGEVEFVFCYAGSEVQRCYRVTCR